MTGFLVDDFDATRARTIANGIELIGEPQEEGGSDWNHYRATDGNFYEIIERAGADPDTELS